MSNTFQRFSNNVVCIDISGPELTNLDFVDLPGEQPSEWRRNLLSSVPIGLIQNASSEVVSFIENMVTSHIKGNCIILVTLPMSGTCTVVRLKLLLPTYDIRRHRQPRAVQLAKQVDPAGIRTIGTLYPHFLRNISQTSVWLLRRPHETRYTSVRGYSSKGPMAGRHRRTQTYY